MYCTQFPQQEIEERTDLCNGEAINAAREHAKQIYNNSFNEKADDNAALELGESVQEANDVVDSECNVSSEQKQLYEQTKQLLEQSSERFAEVKEKQGEIKKEKDAALEALNESAVIDTQTNTNTNGHSEEVTAQNQIPKLED